MSNTIYCYGSGEILKSVFEGIALIFHGKDHALIDQSVALSASIGLLWAASYAIVRHSIGFFAKSWFLPAFILFNLVFVPKTTVNIVDKVDPSFVFGSVSNVPLGVALVPALASGLAYHLTDLVSSKMNPDVSGVAGGFANSGDFFAAKLLTMGQDLKVTNPQDRTNLKQLVGRCYIWPYVYANVQGKRQAALASDDILGFIEGNPHHLCGSYWEESDGSKKFLDCKNGARRAKAILKRQHETTFSLMGARLLGSGSSKQNNHLKALTKSAWERLTKDGKDAHQIFDQFMMMNVAREAQDDLRETAHLTRHFPELTALQASRSMMQQTQSGVIAGEMASSFLPMFHGSALALLIALFIVVLPLSFLPQGFSLFSTWTKLIFSVALWPVFFAIFEAIAMAWFIKSGAGEMGGSKALSLITQGGLSHAAYDMYGYFKKSLWSVPLVSWFLVSKSSYAMTQFITGVGGGMAASADKPSSEMVEGNISYDNQNYQNLTAGGVALAQQTYGANVGFANKLDTGGSQYGWDATTGHVHVNENVSQMGTNLSSTDTIGHAINDRLSQVQTATQERRVQFETAKSNHEQNVLRAANEASEGRLAINGFSQAKNQQFATMMDQMRQFSGSKSLDMANENSHHETEGVEGHVGLNVGGIAGKLVGLDVGVKASTGQSGQSTDRFVSSVAAHNNWSEEQKKTLTEGVDQINSGNFESRDESSQRLSKDLSSSYEKLKNASDAYSASLSESKALEHAKEMSTRGEFTANRNLNDEVVDYMAQKQFGGDRMAATQYAQNNPDAFAASGVAYEKARAASFFNRISTADISNESVMSAWNQSREDVMGQGDQNVGKAHRNEKLRRDVESGTQQIESRIQQGENETKGAYENAEGNFVQSKHAFKEKHDKHEKNMEQDRSEMAASGGAILNNFGVNKDMSAYFKEDQKEENRIDPSWLNPSNSSSLDLHKALNNPPSASFSSQGQDAFKFENSIGQEASKQSLGAFNPYGASSSIPVKEHIETKSQDTPHVKVSSHNLAQSSQDAKKEKFLSNISNMNPPSITDLTQMAATKAPQKKEVS